MDTETKDRIEALEALARDLATWPGSTGTTGPVQSMVELQARAEQLTKPPTTWQDDTSAGLAPLASLTNDELQAVREWFKSLERAVQLQAGRADPGDEARRREVELETQVAMSPGPWALSATHVYVGGKWLTRDEYRAGRWTDDDAEATNQG